MLGQLEWMMKVEDVLLKAKELENNPSPYGVVDPIAFDITAGYDNRVSV